ncbi:unnamed protein product [Umbelopsis sp. WA50703]
MKLEYLVASILLAQSALGGVVNVPVGRAVRPASKIQKRDVFNKPVFNFVVSYVMDVNIGAPGSETQYTLLVDSGSSNTWVGNNKKYVKTSTSHDTGLSVVIAYGSGNMTGEEYIDRLSLHPDLTVEHQSIGVANFSTIGGSEDGIIGIGPLDLTLGTLSDKKLLVPRVQDNLYHDGTIDNNVVGVSFAPTNIANQSNGVVTFGGVDNTKFLGLLDYVDITTRKPTSTFWGVDIAAKYGDTSLLDNATAIVDTGTTLNLLADEAFNAFLALTGAVFDVNIGLPKVTQDQYQAMQSLYFNIGSCIYELIPDAIRWPKAFNAEIGAAPDDIYLAIGSTGTAAGTDIDIFLGMMFIERYYIALDSDSKQVGK